MLVNNRADVVGTCCGRRKSDGLCAAAVAAVADFGAGAVEGDEVNVVILAGRRTRGVFAVDRKAQGKRTSRDVESKPAHARRAIQCTGTGGAHGGLVACIDARDRRV